MTAGFAAGSSVEDRLRAIEDRTAILDLLHEYCRLVDLLATSELADLFTEDCLVDYGPGMGGARRGRAVVEHALAKGLRRFAATSHYLANATITLDGDRAAGVSYVLAWHRLGGARPDAWLFGQYHDRFARDDNRWRIAERRLLAAGEVGFDVAWNMLPRRFRPEGALGAADAPQTDRPSDEVG